MASASMEHKDDDDEDASDDEMIVKHNLELSIRHLSLDHSRPHFLGKSSGLFFLQAALDMKEAFIGPDTSTRVPLSGARPEFWTELEVSDVYSFVRADVQNFLPNGQTRRCSGRCSPTTPTHSSYSQSLV